MKVEMYIMYTIALISEREKKLPRNKMFVWGFVRVLKTHIRMIFIYLTYKRRR